MRLQNFKRSMGIPLLTLAAASGLVIAIFNYFWPSNGIHGSAGALLVMISSLLMVIAAAALASADGMSPNLRGSLVLLILLDIIGTGLAAYMLEAYGLVAVMAMAIVGCMVCIAFDRAPDGAGTRGAA